MEGACIGIWIKDVPDQSEMKLLEGYSEIVVKRIKGYFLLRFEKPETTWLERIQIKRAIGYIPKFKVIICGGLECIFLAAEAIMRRYKGYYDFGVPIDKSRPEQIRGKCHKYYSLRFQFNRPEIRKEYLTDVTAFAQYFTITFGNTSVNKEFPLQPHGFAQQTIRALLGEEPHGFAKYEVLLATQNMKLFRVREEYPSICSNRTKRNSALLQN